MIYLFVFKIKMLTMMSKLCMLHAYGEVEYFFEEIIDELEEFTSDKKIAHKAFKLDSQMFVSSE